MCIEVMIVTECSRVNRQDRFIEGDSFLSLRNEKDIQRYFLVLE